MDKERLSQFAEKVFVDLAGTMTAGMAYLGVATGLFQVMAGRGPLTIDAVTEASGLQRRYVEEWAAATRLVISSCSANRSCKSRSNASAQM